MPPDSICWCLVACSSVVTAGGHLQHVTQSSTGVLNMYTDYGLPANPDVL